MAGAHRHRDGVCIALRQIGMAIEQLLVHGRASLDALPDRTRSILAALRDGHVLAGDGAHGVLLGRWWRGATICDRRS